MTFRRTHRTPLQLFDYVARRTPSGDRADGFRRRNVHETVDHLLAHGEKVGVLKVRLYRPFLPPHCWLRCHPRQNPSRARSLQELVRRRALYKDVVTALAQAAADGVRTMPRVIGGRYGLASKGFTPGMVKAVFDELAQAAPKPYEGTLLSTG